MRKKLLIIVVAIVVLGGGLIYHISTRGVGHNPPAQSHPTYSLNLVSGKSYMAAKPIMLHYNIQDQDGKVLKDFDVVHEKKMHLIVVRKDRTNFQHVHPTLDEANGTFMIEPFTFSTDGDYRVYADFTASNSQMDPYGMKLPATPYQDVEVGDVSKYVPQPLTADKLTSDVNNFETGLFISPDDDSTSLVGDKFYAGQSNTIAIYINKGGKTYRSLQSYLGALGHMVVLGPDLEFIHAHPQTADISNQSGLIVFAVDFPTEGSYKLFLQTQADNKVTTTDYAVSVMARAGNTKTTTPPPTSNDMNMDGMQGMQH